MKTLILSLLILMSPKLIPAETVAWNTTSATFSVALTHIGSSHTYTYTMEPGYYNHSNKWQLAVGFYNVTFTPVGSSYGPASFQVNGQTIYKYGSSNTDPVTISNVELYEGGGNQVSISAQ